MRVPQSRACRDVRTIHTVEHEFEMQAEQQIEKAVGTLGVQHGGWVSREQQRRINDQRERQSQSDLIPPERSAEALGGLLRTLRPTIGAWTKPH